MTFKICSHRYYTTICGLFHAISHLWNCLISEWNWEMKNISLFIQFHSNLLPFKTQVHHTPLSILLHLFSHITHDSLQSCKRNITTFFSNVEIDIRWYFFYKSEEMVRNRTGILYMPLSAQKVKKVIFRNIIKTFDT